MTFENHPCFSEGAKHTVARIHLPVAPKCNIQCNFCNRDFDCVNESRPGVTSTLLTPPQASEYLDEVMKKIPDIGVIGIAGPGDPFANTYETVETFRLVRGKYSNIHLCVATNGLELPGAVEALAKYKVDHVTVTVNAVDPEIGAKIYSWVRTGGRVYRGIEGAVVLLDRQMEGIRKLKEKGITVKINTVIVPGINDTHAVDVAHRVKELGADIQNCMAIYHVDGTLFESIVPPSREEILELRKETGAIIPQMNHCARCRADAAGLVGKETTSEIQDLMKKVTLPKITAERPYIAVASMEGLFVNQHLGEASAFWIFGLKDGKADLVARRSAPVSGGGPDRWNNLSAVISDCCAVLTSAVGETPRTYLEQSGIRVMTMQGLAREGVEALLNGREIPKILQSAPKKCSPGKSCGGTGGGCG
jgi:nitrogen fixation protein NifB